MVTLATRVGTEMGKTEFQDFSRTIPGFFSFFKDSICSQFCIKRRPHNFFATSHKSERTSCILYFSKTFIFSRKILQNSRTIPGQKALFSNSRSFPRPRSNSRTFTCLCASWQHFCEVWLKLAQWYSCHLKQFVNQTMTTTDND